MVSTLMVIECGGMDLSFQFDRESEFVKEFVMVISSASRVMTWDTWNSNCLGYNEGNNGSLGKIIEGK